jgi:hypothetical protein
MGGELLDTSETRVCSFAEFVLIISPLQRRAALTVVCRSAIIEPRREPSLRATSITNGFRCDAVRIEVTTLEFHDRCCCYRVKQVTEFCHLGICRRILSA